MNAEPDYAFRSYSAGAVDYIAKPFDPWVLRAKVSVFVDLYLKNRQLAGSADPPIAESVEQLEQRVAQLRGILDALRVSC